MLTREFEPNTMDTLTEKNRTAEILVLFTHTTRAQGIYIDFRIT
jgi:hypothetical protein